MGENVNACNMPGAQLTLKDTQTHTHTHTDNAGCWCVSVSVVVYVYVSVLAVCLRNVKIALNCSRALSMDLHAAHQAPLQPTQGHAMPTANGTVAARKDGLT